MLSNVQRKRSTHPPNPPNEAVLCWDPPEEFLFSRGLLEHTGRLITPTSKRNHLREGGMPTVDSFMASGPFSRGCMLGGGGGPLLGCLRRNSWLGVCPKWLI